MYFLRSIKAEFLSSFAIAFLQELRPSLIAFVQLTVFYSIMVDMRGCSVSLSNRCSVRPAN